MLKAVSRYIADRQGTEISKVDGDALLRGYQIHAMNRTSPKRFWGISSSSPFRHIFSSPNGGCCSRSGGRS